MYNQMQKYLRPCTLFGLSAEIEPKSVTAFNLFTFFRADLTQSEASWQLSSSSDWLIPYLN